MKIALLSKYTRLGASSRLRTMQYLPYLQKAEIEVQVLPLFDDAYLQKFYSGKGRSRKDVFDYYCARVQALRTLVDVDLVWLEKEAFPYIPYWLEKLFLPSHIPYVVDYDDAIFHNYDLSGNPLVRCLLSHKIDKIMENASMVVCGNDNLATRAIQAGAQRIEILPTVVDISRYEYGTVEQGRGTIIGWVGSPYTQKYVQVLHSVLQGVCNNGLAQLALVGAHQGLVDELYGVPVEIFPWEEETEPESIARFDIGIMPLPDEPFERGKCGYKLIQYMACGLPVVASPVGVNREIVEHGVNGFLAETDEEWVKALVSLRDNPELRRKMGAAGRRKVEEKYSLQVTGPRYLELLRSVIEAKDNTI